MFIFQSESSSQTLYSNGIVIMAENKVIKQLCRSYNTKKEYCKFFVFIV